MNLDGNEVFFSDRKDGKKLYKVNIWTGKETALCDKECHYDVVIEEITYILRIIHLQVIYTEINKTVRDCNALFKKIAVN